MTHQTLYKRTSTGATQIWFLESEGNKFRTHSGQLGGKIVTSEWTVCQGKNLGRANETTPEQQALSEVESQYTKKRKAGYLDTPDAAQESTRFSPMLAKQFEDYADKLEYPVYCQPKLDGIRCIARKGSLTSRAGNPILACPHILEALAPVFEKFPDLVLDGELYNHDLKEDFNTIVSLVKKQKPTAADLTESKRLIQYWVYDSPSEDKFHHRANIVAGVVGKVGEDPLICVPTTMCESRARLDSMYDDYLRDGYEGQIVRVLGFPYEQKRTKNLLKRKEFVDSEFEVLAIEEGIGNRSGMAGYAVLRLVDNKTFKANIKGDRAFLRSLLAGRDRYVGKQATVEYFKPTPDGVPRFPRIKAFHVEERW